MIKKSISIIILIGLWQLMAIITNRQIILPYPITVFERTIEILLSKDFYLAVFCTLFKANISIMIALICGIGIGLMASLNKAIEDIIGPIISIIQTIPQVSFMIIFLFWFDSFTCIMIIVILMTLPIVYNNVVSGINHIDSNLIDIIHLYHHSLSFNIKHVYLPLIKSYINAAIDTIVPLSLKVCVMAEVLIQSRIGIGAKLFYSRVVLDMVGLLAWTICLILVLLLEVKIIKIIRNIVKK